MRVVLGVIVGLCVAGMFGIVHAQSARGAQTPGCEPGRAQSCDFTLIVPVQLKDMPRRFYQARVSCKVLEVVGSLESLDPIGVGAVAFGITLTDGSFKGNVQVSFNALQGKDPSAAKHYSCALELLYVEGQAEGRYLLPRQRNYDDMNPKEGTVFIPVVRGALPN